MLASIFKTLDIEKGEGALVFVLILLSFFIGVFQITLMVSAEALFLKSFDGDMLGTAYFFSGAAGILLTAIYSGLQSKISFTKAALSNLIGIAAITVGIWYGLTISDLNWFPFILLVLMGPLYILPIISFSGLVLRMFSIRQGKRLFGLVDSGAVFGIIIGGLTTQVLIEAVGETKNLLIIGFVGIFLAIVMQMIVSKFFFNDSSAYNDTETEVKTQGVDESSYKQLFKDPYIRMMSIFVTITMVAMFLIHTSFLVATKSQYPEDAEFAGFLGNFTAAMMILTFIIKTFVYGKMVKTYGLKVSFLILPGVVILFTVGAIISGHVFGTDPKDSGFLFFFLMIALSKLFAVALKEAFQNPSFKILYQSLDKKIRFGIQAKIDGVVNEIAASISGGILFLLSLVSFIGLVQREYIMGLILFGCGWITIKLYSEYQASLKRSLTTLQIDGEIDNNSISLNDILMKNIDNKGVLSSISIRLQQRLHPMAYDVTVQKHKISDGSKFTPIDLPLDVDKLRTLSRSRSIIERLSFAKTISELPSKTNVEIAIPLNELIKDSETTIRIEAIKAITAHRVSELYHHIIDLLDSPWYRNIAFNAIIDIGEDILDLMELSFHKTGYETETRLLIVKAMGIIGGPKAVTLLVNKTNFPDRHIINESFSALKNCNYEPGENTVSKINQEIDSSIGIAAWNITARKELTESKSSERMLLAIDSELTINFDAIYLLLELAYDAKSISHIKDSIESGSSERIGFAIELLDLFISEDIKPKLFPLLEDISEDDRIEQLELYYAIDQENIETTLIDIINKDYNYCSKWTKLCAIHELHEVSETLHQVNIANIFNPDKLIQESAAWATYNKDESIFYDCLDRIDEKEKARLITLITNKQNSFKSLLFAKLIFLKNIQSLSEINNESLYEIARNLQTVNLSNIGDTRIIEEEFTGFVITGSIGFSSETDTQNINVGGVFGSLLSKTHNTSTLVAITKDTICYTISNSTIYQLITKEPNLIELLYSPIVHESELTTI